VRRLALLLLLVGCHRTEKSAPPASEIYAGTCARCHGTEGRGGLALPGMPPPRDFHDGAFQSSRSDAELKKVIREGKPPAMPAFGGILDDAQLDGLVSQIRTYK